MAENEIRIPVTIELIASGGGQGNNTGGVIPGGAKTVVPPNSGKGSSFMGGLTAGLFLEGGKRLLSAFGQNDLVQTIEQGSRYAFLGARALSGSPTAFISLATSVAAEIIRAQKAANEQKITIEFKRERVQTMINGRGMR
jgi:hypothetical protein